MARNPEKNALVREERKMQILDAALSVYVRFGYHGTDMDTVAKEAKLAKGLVYYYYKTKNELFAALYTWMFEEGYSFSKTLLENAEDKEPIEQLMTYVYGIFGANKANPRMMQFFIRVPFDAYAIFSPEKWVEGAAKSDMHRQALTDIIRRGISQGDIPETNPGSAANSFWTVFVATLFEYSRLMVGAQERQENDMDVLREVVRFCFQGLGIDYEIWNTCLEKVIAQNREGDSENEGI